MCDLAIVTQMNDGQHQGKQEKVYPYKVIFIV